jgi:hypothetical protein
MVVLKLPIVVRRSILFKVATDTGAIRCDGDSADVMRQIEYSPQFGWRRREELDVEGITMNESLNDESAAAAEHCIE